MCDLLDRELDLYEHQHEDGALSPSTLDGYRKVITRGSSGLGPNPKPIAPRSTPCQPTSKKAPSDLSLGALVFSGPAGPLFGGAGGN